MAIVLPQSFYNRPTSEVAKELLGKFLYREIDGNIYAGKIVEVEAYLGKKDLACHTSKGKTERNKVMFGSSGHAYIYFVYGMHFCFNIVTEKENNPCAVLIRALEPIDYCNNFHNLEYPAAKYSPLERQGDVSRAIGISQKYNQRASKEKLLNGPAKLCREFKIDKELNGWDLTLGKKLWLEKGEKIKPSQIKKSKRIGVDYAGKWKDRLLRFYIKDSKFVSKKER